jgi:ADP-ribose pyrophosphatase
MRVRTVYRGHIVRVEEWRLRLGSGRTVTREVVRHPGAVVVLPRLPDGRFILVRQFRLAVGHTLLEAVAGTLKPGERPERCAARELREESGFAAARLVRLGKVYPVPGYGSEVMHFFFADLQPGHSPLPQDEDENVTAVALTKRELERRIRTGEVRDAKTLAIWLLYRARKP